MKSFQILENVPVEEQSEYSELQVLQSAAGYYIGTIHTAPDGFQEPGSRDSYYFPTKEEAQEALNCLTSYAVRYKKDIETCITMWEQWLGGRFGPQSNIYQVGYRMNP